MEKYCERYVGISCVDGSCPCIDEVLDCENCYHYEGCFDCYFCGTEYCKKNDDCEKGGLL